jgi:hypothetical protein
VRAVANLVDPPTVVGSPVDLRMAVDYLVDLPMIRLLLYPVRAVANLVDFQMVLMSQMGLQLLVLHLMAIRQQIVPQISPLVSLGQFSNPAARLFVQSHSFSNSYSLNFHPQFLEYEVQVASSSLRSDRNH